MKSITSIVSATFRSVVSPAVAATTANETNSCQCSACSLAKSAKVSVVEVKGLEKNEAIAKALKNEDIRKLMDVLTKNFSSVAWPSQDQKTRAARGPLSATVRLLWGAFAGARTTVIR